MENQIPFYGCLTGITLPTESLEIAKGITLRQVYVDMFAAPMMAFAPPAVKGTHHPAPWKDYNGGFVFKSRVELAITDTSAVDNLPPRVIGWLIAALLRLQLESPLRLAVIGNVPFDQMTVDKKAQAEAFEDSLYQFGLYRWPSTPAQEVHLSWLRNMLPNFIRLHQDERFSRAFSVYEQSQWCHTLEISMVLVWTALEALFDLGTVKGGKGRALAKALSGYVCEDATEREIVAQRVREIYEQRGRVVHVGRGIEPEVYEQTMQLARIAFRRVVVDEKLPDSPQKD